MLEELPESEATGAIASIYAGIRTTCAVPYVSSLQRHLATRPGWLEWAWHNIGPAFVNGHAPARAWAASAALEVPRLPPLSRAALEVLGVAGADVAAVRDTCASFVRVSPTNLMFSALTRMQLTRGNDAERTGVPPAAQPPAPLPPLPAMVDVAALPEAERLTLMQLGNTVDGKPFVPGLYRMLARWPAYLAHVATVLGPHFDDADTRACCDRLLARMDEVAGEVLPTLAPPDASIAPPPVEEHAGVLAAMEQYRRTSPQMVVFGTMLMNALPRD